MGRRMSHSVKRKKSQFEQFRMSVPADVRNIVGKREWTESLGTTDPLLARELRSKLVAKHTGEIRRIREGVAARAADTAVLTLEGAFNRLAVLRGSIDKAIAEQLQLLGTFAHDSWAGTDPAEQRQWWGEMSISEPIAEVEAVASIDSELERDIVRLRAELVEGRGIADGLVYQDLAKILYKHVYFARSGLW